MAGTRGTNHRRVIRCAGRIAHIGAGAVPQVPEGFGTVNALPDYTAQGMTDAANRWNALRREEAVRPVEPASRPPRASRKGWQWATSGPGGENPGLSPPIAMTRGLVASTELRSARPSTHRRPEAQAGRRPPRSPGRGARPEGNRMRPATPLGAPPAARSPRQARRFLHGSGCLAMLPYVHSKLMCNDSKTVDQRQN
jgi:hypothetical protein